MTTVIPRVRLDQVGQLPGVPFSATLVTSVAEPVPWRLEQGGRAVRAGTSVPCGLDPSAGFTVHTLEVGALTAPGEGFTLEADGATSHPFRVAADLHVPLAADALRFFHLQRSGVAIGPEVAGAAYARPAGHTAACAHGGDTRVPCLPAGRALTADGVDLYEGWTDGHVLDVSGGWYDAGDQGKYVVNGGIAIAQLLGTYERLSARAAAGAQVDGALLRALHEEARWELEWMLRMRVPAGSRYAGLVHHKVHDEAWTPLPTLPHLDPRRRFLHRPSTAATLNLAAAAAQGTRVLAAHDATFAAQLLSAARETYAAALAQPVLLAPDTNVVADFGGGPYDDAHLDDERYWAAAELYLTTGESAYLADLRANPCHVGGVEPVFVPEGYDWKSVAALARIDLATVPGDLPEREEVRASVVAAAEGLLATQAAEPFGTPYAPRDGRYDWGSTGLVLNLLTVLLAAADVTGEDRFVHGAATGLGHVLGRNALGLSYVTGYGTDAVHHQHSRWYAGQLDPTLPDPPPGTVSGGPNSSTQDEVAAAAVGGLPAQRCFVDDIGAWSVNELTINWNAPLVQVAALLAYRIPGTTGPA